MEGEPFFRTYRRSGYCCCWVLVCACSWLLRTDPQGSVTVQGQSLGASRGEKCCVVAAGVEQELVWCCKWARRYSADATFRTPAGRRRSWMWDVHLVQARTTLGGNRRHPCPALTRWLSLCEFPQPHFCQDLPQKAQSIIDYR